MKHEFDRVAILCTTDEQIRHLGELAGDVEFIRPLSNGGYTYFRQNTCEASIYANYDSPAGKPVVTYEEFIAGMQETETQVVEVAECERCPLVDSYHEYVVCNHPTPSNTQTTSLIEKFSTCPLKKGAVTIKLKEQWQKK